MSSGAQRAAQWALLVTATLVIVGVFLQVYFIAAYTFGAGEDALDAHRGLGHSVEGIAVLAFLAALVAYWKVWAKVAPAFALAVISVIQVGFADADEWVAGFHGLLALVMLILAHAVVQRTVRDLGLGKHGGASPH
jgi:hypothetical protein